MSSTTINDTQSDCHQALSLDVNVTAILRAKEITLWCENCGFLKVISGRYFTWPTAHDIIAVQAEHDQRGGQH